MSPRLLCSWLFLSHSAPAQELEVTGYLPHYREQVADNLPTRRAFVRNLTTFLETHQLDGADLDWEHPKSKSEIESFQKLILELKTAFRRDDFELTVPVADWGKYLNPETVPFGDRIQVMAYDQGTPHASHEKSG